jgi:hypothetical protein
LLGVEAAQCDRRFRWQGADQLAHQQPCPPELTLWRRGNGYGFRRGGLGEIAEQSLDFGEIHAGKALSAWRMAKKPHVPRRQRQQSAL